MRFVKSVLWFASLKTIQRSNLQTTKHSAFVLSLSYPYTVREVQLESRTMLPNIKKSRLWHEHISKFVPGRSPGLRRGTSGMPGMVMRKVSRLTGQQGIAEPVNTVFPELLSLLLIP